MKKAVHKVSSLFLRPWLGGEPAARRLAAGALQGETLRTVLPESEILSYKFFMNPDLFCTLRKHGQTPCAGPNVNPVALAGHARSSDGGEGSA
jgi:hypothetical protein